MIHVAVSAESTGVFDSPKPLLLLRPHLVANGEVFTLSVLANAIAAGTCNRRVYWLFNTPSSQAGNPIQIESHAISANSLTVSSRQKSATTTASNHYTKRSAETKCPVTLCRPGHRGSWRHYAFGRGKRCQKT